MFGSKTKICNNKVKEWMDRLRSSIGSIFKFDLKETSSWQEAIYNNMDGLRIKFINNASLESLCILYHKGLGYFFKSEKLSQVFIL